MSAANPKPVPEAPAFSHQPLDLSQSSIRLIRVLPTKSQEGYIQCEMRHASIGSKYECLSYVWGQPSDNWITIDGKVHSVRDNLLAFLQVAQQKSVSSWLWIDAICIDQTNTAERIHQVQQMGAIYVRAVQVIAWLGTDRNIANFLRFSSRLEVLEEWVKAFVACQYWTRAWVTQEIFLASRVILMAGIVELPLADLPNTVREIPPGGPDKFPQDTRIWPNCFSGSKVDDWRLLRGRSLVQLVLHFRRKSCVELQDRVYSVLGICIEGSELPVDYERTDEQLAVAVILSCKRSFCLCTLFGIPSALGVSIPRHALFSCLNDGHIWQQHHVEIALSLVCLTEPQIGVKSFEELLPRRDGWIDSISLSGVCCERWTTDLHTHSTAYTKNANPSELIISIPPRCLCAMVYGGFFLTLCGHRMIGHCYVAVSGHGDEGYMVSESEIFDSSRSAIQHLKFDGQTGSLTLSFALLFWLGKLYEQAGGSMDSSFDCCSAVEARQPVLRLCAN